MQFCAELGITKIERDRGEEEGLGEDKFPLKVSLPGDRAGQGGTGWGPRVWLVSGQFGFCVPLQMPSGLPEISIFDACRKERQIHHCHVMKHKKGMCQLLRNN